MSEGGEVVVTVRVIKSFEYRTCRNIILTVDPARTTVDGLKSICLQHIREDAKFKPYRNGKYDTLKIYSQAFGNKTQNLIINLDDKGFLDDGEQNLEAAGVHKETELSLFSRELYDKYAKDPVMRW
ncbi:hypothetical protein GGF46_001414 [Coemansia sp. RSA 552]|nr:hypothetical protein GGF46_001414 [Coemansia sp. RSA 552]